MLGSTKRIASLFALCCLGATGTMAACSSAEDVASPPADAGDESVDAPRSPPDAGGDVDAGPCVARPLDVAPRWAPPRPWHQNACTPAEIADWMVACSQGTDEQCASFRAASPGCHACIESSDTDPATGPVIFFENRSYSDLNYAGCLANALGDTTPTGCGASRGIIEDCARRACRGCYPITGQTTLDAFSACRVSPGVTPVCASELASFLVKCGDHLEPGPSDPTRICNSEGKSIDIVIRTYLTLWCSEPQDGGADAGDAAED
jgi:hypothetical protein